MNTVKFESSYAPRGDADDHWYVALEVISSMPLVRMHARKMDFQIHYYGVYDGRQRWEGRGSGCPELCAVRFLPDPSAALYRLLVRFTIEPDVDRLLDLLDAEYPFATPLTGPFRRRSAAWRAHLSGPPAPARPTPYRGIDLCPPPDPAPAAEACPGPSSGRSPG